MSSALPRRRWRTITVRLTAYYSAYFAVSVLLLLGLAYLLLSASLERKDREAIRAELMELAALYRSGGLAATRDFLAAQEASGTAEPFAVRLLGSDDTVLFLWNPSPLVGLDVERLRSAPVVPEHQWNILSAPRRGAPTLEMTAVVLPDGARLEVGGSTADREDVLGHFRRTVVMALLPVLAFGVVGTSLLAASALRPLRDVVQAVRAVTAGEMQTRVPARQSGDELDQLILVFNGLLDRVDRLIEGMRGALDNVAHELRTPIMRIRGTAELALQAGTLPEVQQSLGQCIEELDQLLAMLTTLMDISEAEAGALKLRPERVDLATLIDEMAELYQYVAQDKAVALSTAAASGLWVMADRNRLRQVVANLLDNAIKYTAAGGHVEVSASRDPRGAVLAIRDTGIGIPAGELPRIWERLYRGEANRAQPGLGLGLSLVRAVIHAHHGRIEVHSRPGTGSEFTVILPADAPRPAAGASAELSPL